MAQARSNHRDLVLGIDPGFTGGLVFYSFHTNHIVQVLDMPLVPPDTLKIGSDHRHALDSASLAGHIAHFTPRLALAVIERVHAAPKQGVSSTFRFGEGFGILQGIMAAYQIRTIYPHPSVWKIAQGVTSDKKTSLSAALAFAEPPSWRTNFSRVKDHGRAEAFLLARFGAAQLKAELLN